jgi:hypothetical protein
MGSAGSAQALTFAVTFGSQNGGVSAANQALINSALSFYSSNFTDPITVALEFHNDPSPSVYGRSDTLAIGVAYDSFRDFLARDATSANDAIALEKSVIAGTVDPVIGKEFIWLKTATARAIGANLAPSTTGGSCSSGTFDGCIALNFGAFGSAATTTALAQHEINEVLGLGSILYKDRSLTQIRVEDLFRWESTDVRSFSTNADVVGCHTGVGAPAAFFSIDGGATLLNQFNNCSNGGDYGDWISHSPSQVQDAFGAGGAMTLSSTETVALDVIGYTLAAAVPEPGSWALMLLGMGATARAARRRQRG